MVIYIQMALSWIYWHIIWVCRNWGILSAKWLLYQDRLQSTSKLWGFIPLWSIWVSSWLVVWNQGMLWLSMKSWEWNNHPNGPNSIIFQRGRSTTNQKMFQFIVFPPYLGYLGMIGWDDESSWDRSQHVKPTRYFHIRG